MTRNSKILTGIIIICCLVFIAAAIGIFTFIYKYSKYDMKIGESPDLYIIYSAAFSSSSLNNVSLPPIAGARNVNSNYGGGANNMASVQQRQSQDIEGIFTLVLPDNSLTDVHFSSQNIAGLLVSKEVFDSYEDGGAAKKAFLPSFKAAILNTKAIAMLYNSAKQAEGKKGNAYDKFEDFKKENGVAPNAAIRIAYSDLSCIDYVPVDISYETIGEMFGLVKLSAENVD